MPALGTNAASRPASVASVSAVTPSTVRWRSSLAISPANGSPIVTETTAGLPAGIRVGTMPRKSATSCDVFVAFGITGDLAKVMTFNSLYRLEARGLLDCPIVGVAFDDWSDKDLRDHARKAIETSSGKKPDPKVFNRLAKRLSYVQGDFAEADTYERLAAHIKGAKTPVFYLEIPPSLFGMTIKGLAEAGLTEQRESGRREALRPRPRLRPRACRGDPSVHP